MQNLKESSSPGGTRTRGSCLQLIFSPQSFWSIQNQSFFIQIRSGSVRQNRLTEPADVIRACHSTPRPEEAQLSEEISACSSRRRRGGGRLAEFWSGSAVCPRGSCFFHDCGSRDPAEMGRKVTVATCALNQWVLDFEGNTERILRSKFCSETSAGIGELD